MRHRQGNGTSHATDRAFIARELAEDNYDFAHRYDDEPDTPPPDPPEDDPTSPTEIGAAWRAALADRSNECPF